jgi:hypothetical protein
MTVKQNIARRRNWNKFRLLGVNFDYSGLTKEERLVFETFRSKMIINWDKNTIKLGLKPGKKLFCEDIKS